MRGGRLAHVFIKGGGPGAGTSRPADAPAPSVSSVIPSCSFDPASPSSRRFDIFFFSPPSPATLLRLSSALRTKRSLAGGFLIESRLPDNARRFDMLTHDYKSVNVFGDKIMDSNRHCVRRLVPHKEAEFSSQSIMKAMEKFVQAVQDMDETILVPSRLMDLQVGDDGDTVGYKGKRTEREGLSSTDLYRLYTMVNCVKNELLWGANDCPVEPETTPASQSQSTSHKTHLRRPSTTSMASTNSAGSTLSDTDSETGNENDSGIEGEAESSRKPGYTEKIEESFRRHLYGLHRSLEQMTEAASYLTKRYQSDIGATV